jgi:hypothetical protein
MKTTIKAYSKIKQNFDSVELEIYDLKDGVRSISQFYTELQGDFAKLSECLQSQGYQCSEAVFIKA